jgi:tRNA threonylcarbamoyladenosine biosynthesis protein TsaE
VKRSWRTTSPAATREVGRELARELAPDGALLLEGDLGAGKTVLVQGLAEGLGLDPTAVQSPTFTLHAVHRGSGGVLHHFDLYRLSAEEVAATGFEELLLGPGVKAVEWAERLPFAIPGARVIRIRREGEARAIDELDPGADEIERTDR